MKFWRIGNGSRHLLPSSEIVSRKERRERKMHWKQGRAKNAGNAKCIGNGVAQRTQGTQNSLEGVSLKACSEHKMHWKSCLAKNAGNAKYKTLFPQATLVAKGKVLNSARA